MNTTPAERSMGPGPTTPAPSSLLRWSVFFLAMAGLALLIDVQAAEICRGRCVWGEVGKLISLSEAFAHGMGVATILLTVAVLDPHAKRRLPRLLTLTFGAGLICDVGKVVFPRARPNFGEPSISALDSFLGWGPIEGLDGASRLFESGIQSFPSGHATVAAGLAIGLTWMYPRGRRLFVFLAVLAAAQRVASGAHYPSDVLAGASLACLVAAIGFSSGGLGGWFTRLETASAARRDGVVRRG